MGISFTFAFDDAAPRLVLERLDDAMGDMTDFMDSVGRALVNSAVERIILTNVSPEGEAWEPSQRVKDHGGKTLHLSGLLGNSIAHMAAPDHVAIGSNLIYARVMQQGAAQGEFGAAIGRTRPSEKRPKSQDYFTPMPWGDIPARPYLGVSDADMAIIGDLLEVHFADAAGATP